MPITYPNLSPGPSDSTNVLLGKILQRMGGFAQPGDTGWDLLYRILAALDAASGGGGGGNTTINGTLTVTGDTTLADVTADHILATCADILIAGHAAIKGVGGNNIGVLGTGAVAGVKGVAFNTGVLGESDEGPGVRGTASGGNGVEGYGLTGGVFEGLGTAGLYAFDAAGGTGVRAESAGGLAITMAVTGASTNFFTATDADIGGGVKATLNRKGMLSNAGCVPVPVVGSSSGANLVVDCSKSCHFRYTLTENVLLTPTGGVDGQRIVIELVQDNVGGRTISTGSPVAYGTDIPSITLTTTPNRRDYLTLVYNGDISQYCVVAFVKGY